MPLLHARDQQFNVEVVVFDKDGTLIDFNRLWGPRTAHWIEALLDQVDLPHLAPALYQTVGYDNEQRHVVPDGPLAVGTTNDVLALAAGIFYQNGFRWDEAKALVTNVAAETMTSRPTPAEIEPRGDVLGTLQRLKDAGIQIAVATNDDRVLTEFILTHLGIADLVDALACGDDPIPPKPDGTVLAWLASQLDSSPPDMVMVGDTANDLLTGRNAAVAGCIGILNGAGLPETMELYADVLLASIDELKAEP